MTHEFVIINKKGGAARRLLLKDDIWELSEERMINDFSEVIDNNKLVYSLQSSQIKLKIAEKLKNKEIDPEVKARLEDLDGRITENSNPVIFRPRLSDL